MSVLLLSHVMHGNPHTKKRFSSLMLFFTCTLAGTGAILAQSTEPSTAQAQLRSDADVATAGYFQLSWSAEEAVRLYESSTAGFESERLVYEGSDSGHAVSGRSNGTLFYRLESAATGRPLGQPLRVEVAHHPLSRALAFFTVGAVVFAATLLLVAIGSKHAGTAAPETSGNGE